MIIFFWIQTKWKSIAGSIFLNLREWTCQWCSGSLREMQGKANNELCYNGSVVVGFLWLCHGACEGSSHELGSQSWALYQLWGLGCCSSGMFFKFKQVWKKYVETYIKVKYIKVYSTFFFDNLFYCLLFWLLFRRNLLYIFLNVDTLPTFFCLGFRKIKNNGNKQTFKINKNK